MSENSANSKRIAKNTLMLYFRMLLMMGVTLYTSRVVLGALGIEDYGIYNVVGGILTMLTFVNGALSTASSRFLTFELGISKDKGEGLQRVFRTNFTIHLILASLVFVLAQIIGVYVVNNYLVIPENRIVAANIVFQVAILSAFLSISQTPLTALIISHEQMNIYAYIGISDSLFKLLIAYLISHYPHDRLSFYAFLLFGVAFLNYIFYNFYCWKKFKAYSLKPLLDKKLYSQILSFSGWNLLGSASVAFKGQGVNMLLNMFYGPAVNAAWGIAYQVNNAVASFNQNFTTALNPQIIKTYAAEKYSDTISLLTKGAKLSIYLMLLLSLPLILETKYILNLWLSDVPNHTVIFTQLVLIIMVIESVTYTIGATIQASGNIKKYQICVSGLMLFNLPVAYIVLKLGFAPYCVLLVSILLTFASVIIRVLLLKKIIRISAVTFIINTTIKPIIIGLISYSLTFIVRDKINCDNELLEFLFTSLLCSASTIILVLLVGLSKGEKDAIHKIIASKRA